MIRAPRGRHGQRGARLAGVEHPPVHNLGVLNAEPCSLPCHGVWAVVGHPESCPGAGGLPSAHPGEWAQQCGRCALAVPLRAVGTRVWDVPPHLWAALRHRGGSHCR